MQRALREADKTSELLILEDAEKLTGPAKREQILAATLAFVTRHNPPAP